LSRNGVFQSARWARTILIAAFRAGLCLQDTTMTAKTQKFAGNPPFKPNLRTAGHQRGRVAAGLREPL
jgi:hypothetical protein